MAKLPGIVQQPVGEFQSGQIPQPNYLAVGNAWTKLLSASADAIKTVAVTNSIAQVSDAEGSASTELSELRSTLENEKMLPFDMVPDDVLAEMQMSVPDGLNEGRREIVKPFVRTHEVANEIWAKRSREIVEHHAQSIQDPKARLKFTGDMLERYVAPGTSAINANSIKESRAALQAQLESTLQDIASSSASLEDREDLMRNQIARGVVMGLGEEWGYEQLQAMGPMIDQIDFHNAIRQAKESDELTQIEEELWVGNNRMTPETRRTMNVQIDRRRQDFEDDEKTARVEYGDELLAQFIEGDLTNGQLADAARNQSAEGSRITTLYNMLNKGSTTKISNPAVLSRFELEIARLPYTGGTALVSDKAQVLERQILGLATGTDPMTGEATGTEPVISGTDALTLIEKVRNAPNKIMDNDPYREAVRQVKALSGVRDEISGLFGNQANIDAYVAFKNALDGYMDQFGVDADPISFVSTNRGMFNFENFDQPVNVEYAQIVPRVTNYMEEVDGVLTFSEEKRAEWMQALTEMATTGTMSRDEANVAAAYFMAFYQGRGVPPQGGSLQLPPESEFYGQFR